MNLLCTSVACVGFWPPLMVGSLQARLRAGLGIGGEPAVLSPAATTTDSS